MNLFLDDERFPTDVTWISLPKDPDWAIVRNQKDFERWITDYGIPEFISFDADLGNEIRNGSGRGCVNWLIDRVLDEDLGFPENFDYAVHSKNTVSNPWIDSTIANLFKYYDREIRNNPVPVDA